MPAFASYSCGVTNLDRSFEYVPWAQAPWAQAPSGLALRSRLPGEVGGVVAVKQPNGAHRDDCDYLDAEIEH